MSAYCVREAQAEDESGIQHLLSRAQPSGLVSLGFERAPSYRIASCVSHEQPEVLVAEECASGQIVAVMNLGWRTVHVNRESRRVRYVGDLRIDEAHQGGRLLIYLNRELRRRLGNDWYQTIILSDNQRSLGTFDRNGRAGLPLYLSCGRIETYTLVSNKKNDDPALPVRKADVTDVPAMNAFMQRMAAHFQFLPLYDFSDLSAPYYLGLKIDDFVLVERDGEICAIGALWNQKAFKQTRVTAYSPLMILIRPLINLFSLLFGGVRLPPRGGHMDYLQVHSAMSNPQDVEAFSSLLQALWRKRSTAERIPLVLSLAESDSRRSVLRDFRVYRMEGRHFLAAYDEKDLPKLDQELVPYFECGRL